MGQQLEQVIRRYGLTISDVALALKINRRTLYNWFKQEVLDEHKVSRVSEILEDGLHMYTRKHKELIETTDETLPDDDELYWQEKYIELVNSYTRLLKSKKP